MYKCINTVFSNNIKIHVHVNASCYLSSISQDSPIFYQLHNPAHFLYRAMLNAFKNIQQAERVDNEFELVRKLPYLWYLFNSYYRLNAVFFSVLFKNSITITLIGHSFNVFSFNDSELHKAISEGWWPHTVRECS